MEATGISQLPVMDANGRQQRAGVALARVLHDGRDPALVPVGEVMAARCRGGRPHHLDETYLLLAGYTRRTRHLDGRVVDIVTRIDPDSLLGQQPQEVNHRLRVFRDGGCSRHRVRKRSKNLTSTHRRLAALRTRRGRKAHGSWKVSARAFSEMNGLSLSIS
ncbi:MAG: hypothetical protein U0791_22895 [Gemmataceae bacterium]